MVRHIIIYTAVPCILVETVKCFAFIMQVWQNKNKKCFKIREHIYFTFESLKLFYEKQNLLTFTILTFVIQINRHLISFRK